MPDYLLASTREHYEAAKSLFVEYADWLAVDLCFQHFGEELNSLDKIYAMPEGGIVLCVHDGIYIGCVGIRKIDEQAGEMKRLYVKPGFRNIGIASTLINEAEELAKQCGYRYIRLDTLDTMKPAVSLYKKKGYLEIPPYYYNPIPGAVYFQKDIDL